MNISVYTRGHMSGWYAEMLSRVLTELGYSSQLLNRRSKVIIDDDITFFILYGKSLEGALQRIKHYGGKTKCVVLVETEQIFMPVRQRGWFIANQEFADVVVFPISKQLVDDTLIKKPTLNMPLGYHPWLQRIGKPMDHRDIFTLEGPRTLRQPFLNAIKSNGFSSYDDLYIFDLQEISNRVSSVDICLTSHAYGSGSFLSTFRVIGLFIYNRGFVMSQRADEPFLEENKHIVYFDTVEEMVEKCRYYVSHQDEARKIAEEAYRHLKTLPMVGIVKSTVDEICKLKGW